MTRRLNDVPPRRYNEVLFSISGTCAKLKPLCTNKGIYSLNHLQLFDIAFLIYINILEHLDYAEVGQALFVGRLQGSYHNISILSYVFLLFTTCINRCSCHTWLASILHLTSNPVSYCHIYYF